MGTAATARPPRGLSQPIRAVLFAVAALLSVVAVAQTAIALLDLATRHTTTGVERFDGVRSLVIDDGSDVRLTTAPAGAPLELRTKVTEGLRSPTHDARVTADGALRLSSSCGWAFGGNSCSVDYEVRVPAGTQVRVNGSSGDVRADGLRSAQPVVLRASSGDVHLDGVTAPRLQIETSSGDVHASGVRADEVEAVASSGDIRLSLAAPADSVRAVASSGDIHVLVPDAVYRVDADTSSGDIDDRGVRTAQDAPRSISATASSGDVLIEPR